MDTVANVEAAGGPGDLVDGNADNIISKPLPHRTSESETEIFRQRRDTLQDESGLSYEMLKKSLKPHYGWVWAQISIAYLGLASIIIGVVVLHSSFSSWWQNGLIGLLAGVGIGYLIAFIALWLHEAAHYNLHGNRAWNDWLANVFVGPLLFLDVREYRQIHFAHHKHLGDITDTESSYFEPLNVRYFFESLTGIRVIRVLLSRINSPVIETKQVEKRYINRASSLGLVLHLGIVGGSLYSQQYSLAVAWSFGAFIFYPFFGALRPLLEHRKPGADPTCDYSLQPHGEYTRVFKSGLFSNTFGGAGFNRHLIHHWDPGISCTCFAEVECFFEESELKDFYAARKTTYGKTFLTLLRESAPEKLVNE